MIVERIAAFTAEGRGGNPAGVVIADEMPEAVAMQATARAVGYAETAFVAPQPGGGWRVRYFAPEAEVDFCGHATIALGAALGRRNGPGNYALRLNAADISVETDGRGTATLTSPPSRSTPLDVGLRAQLLRHFGLSEADLDPRLPPRLGDAGNLHPILFLKQRARLAAMAYPFDAVKALMEAERLTTICLVVAENPALFHVRNAFAIGGLVEDPATGAAAAALAGALVDLGWPGMPGGRFTIRQGEDMGVPCEILVQGPPEPGGRVRLTGATRILPDPA
ncbi:PhzF family phenazine biosynthesis isomerase [Frigidibacter sp. RF13]|uniref:PhzF family phenazine biosynthesis protein n=1 Tax=Frigidibacter sp. RF13 TaxID=2997340 RepID=UPI002271B7EB|nr:PhzF family phenazine biosynthesis isomerase [Frigidibacter sp. RF13]MCY1126214.1 PhzF family phenazine biosynthesis isomerase [Frigidibacter sp. RF13]